MVKVEVIKLQFCESLNQLKLKLMNLLQMPKGLNNNYPSLKAMISNRTIEVAALL